MNSINLYIFYGINGFAGQYQWLDRGMIFLTTYLAYSVSIIVSLYVCVLIPYYAHTPKARKYSLMQGFELLLAGSTTALVSLVLKVSTVIPRPFTVLDTVEALLPNQKGYSFPSSHSSIPFAIATVVYFYHRRLGIFLYVFSCVVALSRIYVGVHYPVDVFVGAILGIAIAHVSHTLLKQRMYPRYT